MTLLSSGYPYSCNWSDSATCSSNALKGNGVPQNVQLHVGQLTGNKATVGRSVTRTV